jgi:hypothetical protein
MLTNLYLAVFYLLGLVSNVLAVPKISAVGSKFFTSDGNQFYIKGMRDVHPNRLLRSLLNRYLA